MSKLTKLLVALACILPLATHATSKAEINTIAHQFMTQHQVEGLSIAIIDHDDIHTYNFGYARKNIPVTNDTLYPIASFTKTFTAALAARAAKEGKIDLDQPFVKFFPDLKESALNQITPKQLLAHVSGLPFDFEPKPQSYPAALSLLNHYQPQGLAGSEYRYSNAGIGTMGYVLENAYRQAYQELLEDKVLKPLKMHATYLKVPAERERFMVLGHDAHNQEQPYQRELGAWFAATSLKSSISDMALYLRAQMSPESLGEPSLAQALMLVHRHLYCFADRKSCEQLGWQAHLRSELQGVKSDSGFIAFNKMGTPIFEGQKIIGESFLAGQRIFIDKTCSGYGSSGYMAYLPEERRGVVILANKVLGDERVKLGREILSK